MVDMVDKEKTDDTDEAGRIRSKLGFMEGIRFLRDSILGEGVRFRVLRVDGT